MQDRSRVMEKVRRSLGRSVTPADVPPPPVLADPVVRLVQTEIGLAELFAKQAAEMKMLVTPVTAEQVVDRLLEFVRGQPIRTIAMSVSPILQKFKIREALESAGLAVRTWDEMTLDELYEYDCAITDVDCAVAESGTLVIKPHKGHGRGLSLVPMYHIALIEPSQFLPDLADLFERLTHDPQRGNVIMISGPSKTADIEMNVVTGVHGPNVVNAFILQ